MEEYITLVDYVQTLKSLNELFLICEKQGNFRTFKNVLEISAKSSEEELSKKKKVLQVGA